jgi:hypothetical protein
MCLKHTPSSRQYGIFFHHVGILDLGGIGDRLPQRRHLHGSVFVERRNHFGDHLGLDERQIRLHVDNDFATEIAGRFRDAIGAGAVTWPRQPHDTTKRLHCRRNALVVGGHDDGIDAAGFSSAPVDVFDHRPANDIGENFSRKTRRIVAGRNDDDDVLL